MHHAVITVDMDMCVRFVDETFELVTSLLSRTLKGRLFFDVIRIPNVRQIDELKRGLESCLAGEPVDVHPIRSVVVEGYGNRFLFDIELAPIFDRHQEIVGTTLRFSHREENSQQTGTTDFAGDISSGDNNRIVPLTNELYEYLKKCDSICLIEINSIKLVRDGGSATDVERLGQFALETIRNSLTSLSKVFRLSDERLCIPIWNEEGPDPLAEVQSIRDALLSVTFLWAGHSIQLDASIAVVDIRNWDRGYCEFRRIMGVIARKSREVHGEIYLCHPDSTDLRDWSEKVRNVSKLVGAIKESDFGFLCQRIAKVSDEEPETECHFEILLNILNENGKRIPPGEYIPIAEQYNLMPNFDRFVISRAFEAIGELLRQPALPKLEFSINLSARSLSDKSLLPYIIAEQEKYGVEAESVCFEITETASINNVNRAIMFVGELKSLGSKVAIDDFGSGFASISYLRDFPIDYVKIDGSFVRSLLGNPRDYSLVQGIGSVCRELGIITVAEMVEDRATLQALNEMGIDYAQGFFIEKPFPMMQLTEKIGKY